METFNVLSRNTSIPKHLFLEASAGTGKTFAIENLVVRLILDGVKSDEILVVTFTKAATRELKERIAAKLNECLNIIVLNIQGEIDYLDGLSDRDEALMRVKSALSQIEMMSIYTLHSFCYRSLQLNAFESGLPLMEEGEKGIVLEIKNIILDEFRSLSHKQLHPIQLKILLKKHRGDFKSLIDAVQRLMPFDAHVKPVKSFQESYDIFCEQLTHFPTFSQEEIDADLESLFGQYNKLKSRDGSLYSHFERQQQLFGEILSSGCLKMDQFIELLGQKELFFEVMTEKNLKKSAKPLSLLKCKSLFDLVHAKLMPLLEESKSYDALMLYVIAQFQPAVLNHAKNKPEAFPDALLHQMDQALNEAQFSEKMAKQYRAVIVDEFQDTDPIQWSILEKLCLIDHPQLVLLALIGDPKQSIYSFRNADIQTYLKAKKSMDQNAHRILSTNYRSHPKLMSALNRFFSFSDGNFSFDKETLKFIPVDAAKPNSAWDQSHFQMIVAQGEKGRSQVWPSLEMEENQLFPHIAHSIVSLFSKGHALEDMVVLIKDRFQASRLQHFLEKWNIPTLSTRKSALAKCEMTHFMTHFLHALNMPHHESHIKRLISHRFFGYDHKELLDNLALHDWQCHLVKLKSLFLQQGLAPVLERFFQLDDQRLMTHIMAGHQIEHYGDLTTLRSFLLTKYREGHSSLSSLISQLQNLSLLNPDHHHEAQREVIQGFDAVHIMTTHMSKGLEFEFVFALGVACRSSYKESIVSIRKNDETHLMPYDKSLDEISTRDRLINEEKLRQLYVALTRAKQCLFLYCPIDTHSSSLSPNELSPIELFNVKRALHCHSYRDIPRESLQLNQLQPFLDEMALHESFTYYELTSMSEFTPLSVNHAEDLPLPKKLEMQKSVAPPLSFSQMTSGDERHFMGDEKRQEGQLPAGAQVGSLIHDMFDRIIGLSLYAPYHRDKIRRLIDELCQLTPLEGYEQQLEKMCQRAFLEPLVDGLSLSQLSLNQMWQEVEFIYQQDDTTLIKGFIDLIFEVNDQIYILDWKSNDLGSDPLAYSEQNCQKAICDHQYDLQAAIYASAVNKQLKSYGKRFGGAIYVFLRGLPQGDGIVHFKPNLSLVEKKVKEVKCYI